MYRTVTEDTGVGHLILTILRTNPKKEQMVNGCRTLAYAIYNMHAFMQYAYNSNGPVDK